MSKKKNEQTEPKQPAYIDELLKTGTTILTAKTREELAEMVNDIPADCSYGVGAVGQDRETGLFTLQVNITTS